MRYCEICREDVSGDRWHYHEPIVSRCSVCGAKCGSNLCPVCRDAMQQEAREEREMFGTRVRRGHDQ